MTETMNDYWVRYRRWIVVLAFGLLLLAGSGCGGSRGEQAYRSLNLAEVAGTITLDGKPLANAQVQFEERGSFSYGVTDANGKYRLYFDTHHTGVRPGQKTVRIWTTMGGPGFDQLMQGTPATEETIPLNYNHDSTLTADVAPKKSQTFDFAVTSGGKTRKATSGEGAE
ncbi:MAG: carboxypeptidase-like regulatory domain-containing protein [Thermoguttaceae bacterium]